jgi:hypothetical protein
LPCRPGLTDQFATTSVKSTGKRPNIVLIMADDNDQISWTIGGNCCEFLCFVGVSGEFQTAVVSGEFTGNWGY